ncbi:MAG: sulfotransferase family 2 domain-containing protein [Chloroflexota bacterium]
MVKLLKNSGQNIELLSVHIPKTAGTSFRNTLVEIYRESGVLRVDLPPKKQRDAEDPFAKVPEKLNPSVRVLHGHFNPTELRLAYPGIPEETKMITWVRDPVKRVISNYFYLRERIREVIDENPTLNLGITNRMIKSLTEYAIQNVARDRMAKFISGTRLDEFLFIGVQENYTADLRYLAQELGWGEFTEFFQNKSENKYDQIDEEIKQEIRELNPQDWEIYQQAIEMSAARNPGG